MKIIPIVRQMKMQPRDFKFVIVHTGQHYDFDMSDTFFKDLDIPKPDIYLGIGSTTHGIQTAKVIEGIEKILLKYNFDIIIVVGDVNSTAAAAIAASKLGVRIAHIEAGLRSFDRTMPEEINRILTDHISDYLFTTEESAKTNLIKEGISPKKIFFVGNTMIDTRIFTKNKIKKSDILEILGIRKNWYCLVTIHRPCNVDGKEDIENTITILRNVNKKIRVVFPMHPRTQKMLNAYNLKLNGITVIPPLGYIDFQKLLENSKFVMTDSGGVQEETTFLKIPCITIRTTTERPVTVDRGANVVIGPNRLKVMKAVDIILSNQWKKAKRIPMWDGKASKRIINILSEKKKQICMQNQKNLSQIKKQKYA